MPVEVVEGTWRPTSGQRPADLVIPGPGLYEADFTIPSWMVPDGVFDRHLTFKVGGHQITHLSSTVKEDVLTVRFRSDRISDPVSPYGDTPQEANMGAIMQPILVVVVGALAAVILNSVVQALRELRKIGDGKSPLSIGLAVLALGGGVLLLKGGR